jgi:phage gp46-like protein
MQPLTARAGSEEEQEIEHHVGAEIYADDALTWMCESASSARISA